jgi:predicted PurR-regulated permease PerM
LKPYQNPKYITIAVYTAFVLLSTVSIIFLFLNLDIVSAFFKKLLAIFAPLLYGACIAYALNPLMKFYEEKVFRPRRKNSKLLRSTRRGLSVSAAILSVILFLTLFIAMIIPQLKTSIQDLIEKFPQYVESLEALVEKLAQGNGFVAGIVNAAIAYVNDFASNSHDLLQEYLPMLKDILQSVASVLLDVVLGFVFAAYFLCAKEYIIAQTKKIMKSLCSEKYYGKLAYFFSLTDKTFGKYFVAAILDSMLVGFICFLLVQIAGMPYAPLIGVVIGITNIIPIFGPFIGAIPCALILFVCKPSYAIIFGIMILIVQQIDGNIIVPRIHGSSTGLPPVWIIVSITIMSGLFGFIGMFIGVPCFSVIYMLIKQYIEDRLEKKSFATDTIAYMNPDEKARFLSKEKPPKKPWKENFLNLFKFAKKEKQ